MGHARAIWLGETDRSAAISLDSVHGGDVGGDVVGGEPGQGAAGVIGGQVVDGPDRAGEEPMAQGRVGDETDAGPGALPQRHRQQ